MERAGAAGAGTSDSRSAAGWLDRRLERQMLAMLERLERGTLTLVDSAGLERRFGVQGTGPDARVIIRDARALRRAALGGDVGLGEAYVDGQWDADDVARAISLFHLNEHMFDAPELAGGWPARVLNRLVHLARRNDRAGSRRNIARHYDLGDALFETFLDPSMQYSCAIYADDSDTLERAQQRKIARMLDLARLEPGMRVLEIGCGWGSLAIEAARRGCDVTGITVSDDQLAFARRRAAESGVEDLVRFELRDYRDATGTFDRVISVEMLEAVGHQFLGGFFATLERVLARDGLAALQVITFPDQRYDAYRRGCDWLQKYIFPGGIAPSLTALCASMTRSSRLVVESIDNIGPHYARTLRDWRRRFESHADVLDRAGYDARFRRMWSYYLAYCEAGFMARTFNDLQMVLTRPNNMSLATAAGVDA